MFTFLARTAKYAVQDFWRNFWLSIITITVIFIAILSVNTLVLIKTVSEFTLKTIEEKIDVSVFILQGVDDPVVQDLRGKLLSLEQVKAVRYISPEDALRSLLDRHQNDPTFVTSLEKLGGNPLGAQLIVQARSTSEYDPILAILTDEKYSSIIADQNFTEHGSIIEKVSNVSERVRTIATVLSLIFTLIALIVVFNTLRIIIYTHRDEIGIMRLVGATNWFIRMPYIWQSFLYALFAMGIFMLFWYPALGFMQPFVNDLFVDGSTVDLVQYYNVNFALLFGAQFAGLVVLLCIASILATRKYSRI